MEKRGHGEAIPDARNSGALPARAAIRGRLTRSTHSQAHGGGSPGYAAACSDRKSQRTCGDRRVRPVHMSPPTHTPHRRLHRWRRSGFGTSWTAPAPQRSCGRSAGSPTALAASGPSLARRCSCRARHARLSEVEREEAYTRRNRAVTTTIAAVMSLTDQRTDGCVG